MTPGGLRPEVPRARLLERLRLDLDVTAQATVPGAYAWVATVAPVAFARGAPPATRAAAALGLGLLALAPFVERRRPRAARALSVWGLVGTSLLVWVIAPTGALSRVDAVRGLVGTVGWGLFALASSAPALPRRRAEGASAPAAALRRRGDSGRVDLFVLGVGVALALLLEAVAWKADGSERALLVRLFALAGGVALIGAASALVASRHAARAPDAPRLRLRRALVPLVLVGLLAAGGAVFSLVLGRGADHGASRPAAEAP